MDVGSFSVIFSAISLHASLVSLVFIFMKIEGIILFVQMLVVLTSNGQLFLYAKDGTVIHQTSFAVDGSGGDDLVAYHTQFTNLFGNPEKAYHKCIAVRGASIYASNCLPPSPMEGADSSFAESR